MNDLERKRIADLSKLLFGASHRLELLAALSKLTIKKGSFTMADVRDATGLSFSVLNQGMRRLVDAGVVARRRPDGDSAFVYTRGRYASSTVLLLAELLLERLLAESRSEDRRAAVDDLLALSAALAERESADQGVPGDVVHNPVYGRHSTPEQGG